MKHIVSVGGGIASTLLLPLWLQEHHPGEPVELVMARLSNEDPDVWRLVDAVADLTGFPVRYIGENRHPWQVFFKSRFLGNSRIDPCSRILKREVMKRWVLANAALDDIMYVGIGHQEDDRFLNIYQRWRDSGVTVAAPLRNEKQWTRAAQMEFCQEKVGFVPRLYQMGFQHNNCGGACIKAGQREWARLLYFLPDVYWWWEYYERLFRSWIKKDVAILKDRRGGDTKPLPLRDFRGRIEQRWAGMLPGFTHLVEGWQELEASGALCDLDESPGCASCEAA